MPVQDYLERFEVHERRVLDAVADPTSATVASALAADPTLEPGAGSSLKDAVWASYARHAAAVPSPAALT
jgi:hypothetical protein